MKLAMATKRPQAVIGMHFFNPVPVLKLMELVPTLLTAPVTATQAESFAREVLGRRVIRSKDRAGFIVNALLIPYILSAVRMFESGFATRDDIDSGMVEGCNHPMGPLALADLIGLDTMIAVTESLYEEFKALFPRNAVHYFVSDYEYFRPQSYSPQRDDYVAKRAVLDERLTRLRISATTDLVKGREDVIIVASVSAVYGLESQEDRRAATLALAATAIGLGSCQIGALFDDEANQILGVDGVEESVGYMSVAGRPA